MRIALFSAFYPFRGGIAQFNARLYREMSRQHQVVAFTFKKQYPDFLFPGTSQFVEQSDNADQIPAKRIVSTFNPFTYFKAANTIKETNPDLLITNYWMSFFALFMGFFASRQSAKTIKIAIVHNLIPHEPRFFDRWLNAFFLKRYDAFVVMSKSVKHDVLRVKPTAKLIQLNHPWYDHFSQKIEREEACKLLFIESSKKTILFFGLIRDYKGLDLLIDAFSSLDESYQLIIAGEVYSNLKTYTEQITSSGVADRIYFHNRYIKDEDVHIYFSAADVCVLPYRSATQSGITATSFFYELPIIATNVGDFDESIGKPELGVVIEEPRVELLKNALCEYFTPGKKEFYQNNIRKHKVLNSWESYSNRLISFSKSIGL